MRPASLNLLAHREEIRFAQEFLNSEKLVCLLRKLALTLLLSALLGVWFGVAGARGGTPIAVQALGGAFVNSDLLGSLANGSSDGLMPMMISSGAPGIRYSGAYRDWGATPATNSLAISVSQAVLGDPSHNHLAAWQGIVGSSSCGVSSNYCNWMQAGIAKGLGCYGVGSTTSQWEFIEINYNGTASDGCPGTPNGQGYWIGTLGTISAGSSHTIVAYLCGNTGGCTYDQVFTSSYRRGALRVDGVMQASNVYLDPSSNQRQSESYFEDGYGTTHGDYGTANFTNSTYVFNNPDFGSCPGAGYTQGQISWKGCFLAN